MKRERDARPGSVASRHWRLLGWVQFANAEEPCPPGVPLVIVRNRESLLRDETNAFLRRLAEAAASASETQQIIEGPQPPRSRVILWRKNVILHRANDVFSVLLDELEKSGAVERLRICPVCDKLFVALNRKAAACGPKCSNIHRQRKFYSENSEEEKARKRREYKKHRKVNQVRKRARSKRRFLDGATYR